MKDRKKPESTKDKRRESGLPGGGAGRKDEVGRSGIYPMSGHHPAGNAEIRGQASWGQGERVPPVIRRTRAAGYEDQGSSELTYEAGQALGGYSTDDRDQQIGGHMKLMSPAFSHEGSIPKQFTCEGQNISPALSWTDAPKETKSFVLILRDPDAPKKDGFTHWSSTTYRLASISSPRTSLIMDPFRGSDCRAGMIQARSAIWGHVRLLAPIVISRDSMPYARNSNLGQTQPMQR
jgi:hypothetical protein